MNFIDPGAKISAEPTCHYLVLYCREAWWVDCEGKSFGPCQSKEEAIASAKKLISILGDPERRADVWAPDESGRSRLVWQRAPEAGAGSVAHPWIAPMSQGNLDEHSRF